MTRFAEERESLAVLQVHVRYPFKRNLKPKYVRVNNSKDVTRSSNVIRCCCSHKQYCITLITVYLSINFNAGTCCSDSVLDEYANQIVRFSNFNELVFNESLKIP